MANGPLSRGLLGAVDIATRSQQLRQTQQQINQRQAQVEMDNAFKMINLGIDLEDDALTQSGLDVVNDSFGTTISTEAIGENRKAFKNQLGILREEGKNLRQNPQAIPGFRQAVDNFNIKYSTGKFKEQAEAAVGVAEATIERGEEAEQFRQRRIARGIPQEEGAELTPLQRQQEAAIAGGFTPAQVSGLEPKVGALKNYRLTNGDVVLSDGKTFTDVDGVVKPLPLSGTTLVSTTETIAGIRASQLQGTAQEAVAGQATVDEGVDPETAAIGGTGPYAALKSAADRILGGLGLDEAIGREGLFPETADNRQTLSLLKQVGKPALVNNKRFPVAEQKNVDRLFADPDAFWKNPRIEARKFAKLRTFAQDGIDFNNRAVAKVGLTLKEITEIQANTRELERFLNLLGPGEKAVEATKVFIMPNGERRVYNAAGKRIE